jgi:hypothetical protein
MARQVVLPIILLTMSGYEPDQDKKLCCLNNISLSHHPVKIAVIPGQIGQSGSKFQPETEITLKLFPNSAIQSQSWTPFVCASWTPHLFLPILAKALSNPDLDAALSSFSFLRPMISIRNFGTAYDRSVSVKNV